jgi:hypothetical protein
MLLVLAGALLLRLWQLGARSVWTDEGSTWTAASSGIGELIRLCAQKDASPPLFYLLTALSLRFGDDEAHLRAVSALASLALVWLTYRLARLAVPRAEATLAALCALSPFQLMYAQEARTYALVACFTVASLYLFARAVLFDRPRAWLPYVGMSVLALYTQGISLLGVGVQGALVVGTRAGRRGMLRWVLAQAAAFLLYAPWFFVSLAQASRLHSSHWYLQSPGGHELFQVLRAVFLSPIPLVTPHPGAPFPGLDAWLPRALAHVLLGALPTLPLIAALPSAIGRDRRATVVRLSLAILLLPLLAVWLVSFRQPLCSPRRCAYCSRAGCARSVRARSRSRGRRSSQSRAGTRAPATAPTTRRSRGATRCGSSRPRAPQERPRRSCRSTWIRSGTTTGSSRRRSRRSRCPTPTCRSRRATPARSSIAWSCRPASAARRSRRCGSSCGAPIPTCGASSSRAPNAWHPKAAR